jgi:transposase-like protein
MDHVTEVWGARYPAIIRLWEGAWEQFIPFLDYDIEIRTVLCSTNAIEISQRPVPAGDQGPRSLPLRAGRP